MRHAAHRFSLSIATICPAGIAQSFDNSLSKLLRFLPIPSWPTAERFTNAAPSAHPSRSSSVGITGILGTDRRDHGIGFSNP
jgi:hypothetical protein